MAVDILPKYQSEFQDAVTYLKEDIKTLRTGRANPSIVENVQVEAYGSRQSLLGLASISTPDARTIVVEPWDKNILKDIEKGILEAKIGLNPAVQGQLIRIALPALTEEGRKNLVKALGEKLEHARVGVRSVREKAKAEVVKAEKDKVISEDEKFKLLEQLDKTAAGFNEQIKRIGEEKEKEVMTI
jgi:ribosome recycling factor